MVRTSDLAAVALVLYVAVLSAPAQAEMSKVQRVAQLLGTVRVMTDQCKLPGNPAPLQAAVNRAGFKLTDFVPGGVHWQFTREAMDQRFEQIAQQGIGPACNAFSAAVKGALPAY